MFTMTEPFLTAELEYRRERLTGRGRFDRPSPPLGRTATRGTVRRWASGRVHRALPLG